MKQSLSLNLKQKLLMTPKLQQSINILQLSAYELSELIEQEYMENPALEKDSDNNSESNSEEPAYDFQKAVEMLDSINNNKDDEKVEPNAVDDDFKFKPSTRNCQTLEEHLLEQLDFSLEDKQQSSIAKYIIGLLDENGYLRVDLAEIVKLTGADEFIVEAVLHKIQQMEPLGVGARNLAECLAIQAKAENLYTGLVKAIINKYLAQIAEGKIKEIALLENSTPKKVQAALDIIRKFNPKPGAPFGTEIPKYIIPDVVVRDVNGRLEVTINDFNLPKLHISNLCRQHQDLDANCQKYIEQHVNSAVWLIKSIEQRRTTLLRVTNEIVKQQEEVFRKGFAYMKPLLMKTIAENIGVHESTVSRTVANKYMEMPFGIVALKKFFAGSVSKQTGEDTIIADKIKAMIKDFIEGENKAKPLSDQQIANMLKEKNMAISRRTVMKYREQLGYASSAKRKRY